MATDSKIYSSVLLEKNLNKFINITTGQKRVEDQEFLKADCYRRLFHFREKLNEEMKKIENWLIENEAEVYFIDEKEKILIDEIKDNEGNKKEIALVLPMDKNRDTKRAMKIATLKKRK